MKTIVLGSLFLLFIFIHPGYSAELWQCVPGQNVGPINKNSSESDMVKSFGKENVTRIMNEADGISQTKVVLPFKGAKLYIEWVNDKEGTEPYVVDLWSESPVCKTPEGVMNGLSVSEIEKINGGSFLLNGYEVDYDIAGYVTDWKNGKLKRYGEKNGVGIQIGNPVNIHQNPNYKNKNLKPGCCNSSDSDAIRALNPKVSGMTFEFSH